MAHLIARNPSDRGPRGNLRRLHPEPRGENLIFESQKSVQGTVLRSVRSPRGDQRRIVADSCAGNQSFKSQQLEKGLKGNRKVPNIRCGRDFTGSGFLNDHRSGPYGLGHRKSFSQAYGHGASSKGRFFMTQKVGDSPRLSGPAHLNFSEPNTGRSEVLGRNRAQHPPHRPPNANYLPTLTHFLGGKKAHTGPAHHHHHVKRNGRMLTQSNIPAPSQDSTTIACKDAAMAETYRNSALGKQCVNATIEEGCRNLVIGMEIVAVSTAENLRNSASRIQSKKEKKDKQAAVSQGEV
ncbi:hypothetical protein F0562_025719 [Nyssa sinensis]|uniref:Uncharacterized protein n=1 Tax=Nyssa sinensis TaxID=561372 RepID=A0A5J5BB93_9ASTE|nr:hypothetical protein F0562_025719 [Nyssa sinensis]